MDGDRDELAGGAVHRADRDAVGIVRPGDELVVGAAHRVGPGACRIDAEAAVAIAARDIALRGEHGLAGVDIVDHERARGALRRIGFCQRRARGAGDRGKIIRTGQ